MNMENFTSVFNSADGPTSIFVAGKTPEIMGVLIAIVVVGCNYFIVWSEACKSISAMMGLGTGAVIGAVIGTVAGLDTTKMVATIAVCGSGIVYHVCSTTKIRNICYDFLWIMGDICYPCGSAVSYSTWNLRSGCTGHRNTDSHLCGISGHLCNRYCRRSGSRNGASVSSWDDKDWWIGYVMSAAIAVIGITVQTMMQ